MKDLQIHSMLKHPMINCFKEAFTDVSVGLFIVSELAEKDLRAVIKEQNGK